MSEDTKDFLSNWSATDQAAIEAASDTPAGNESDMTSDSATPPSNAPAASAPAPAPANQTVETPASTAEAPKETLVPLAGMMAEREKRQNLERQLKEAQDRLAQVNAQPPKQFWEDPEGIVNERINQVRNELIQQQRAIFEEQAKSTHADYDEVLNYFADQAKDDPVLKSEITRLMSQPNPAEAAYQFGKRLKVMRDMGDPLKYEQDIEARVRAKVAEEQAQKSAQAKATRDAIPPDLSDMRSTKDDPNALPADEDIFDSVFSRGNSS